MSVSRLARIIMLGACFSMTWLGCSEAKLSGSDDEARSRAGSPKVRAEDRRDEDSASRSGRSGRGGHDGGSDVDPSGGKDSSDGEDGPDAGGSDSNEDTSTGSVDSDGEGADGGLLDEDGDQTKSCKTKSKGGWYQANDQHCPTFCEGKGMTNEPSVGDQFNSSRCASGENRPTSADGVISYVYGVWGQGGYIGDGASVGGWCYGTVGAGPQKVDSDATDRTVGCYCAPKKKKKCK